MIEFNNSNVFESKGLNKVLHADFVEKGFRHVPSKDHKQLVEKLLKLELCMSFSSWKAMKLDLGTGKRYGRPT
jgi:hypothetical protein